VTEYGMIYSNGILKMHFTVPLAEPLDPFAAEFVYRIYDPSFYIAIDFAENAPLALLGNAPEPCRIELRQPPTGAEIEATRDMLAEKDQDWQPPEEDDFGSMFAQARRRRMQAGGRMMRRALLLIVLAALMGLMQAPAALAIPEPGALVVTEAQIDTRSTPAG
jgi:hypothetical protein